MVFKLLISLLALLLLIPASLGESSEETIQCQDHVNCSHPRRQLICNDINDIEDNYVVERTNWKKSHSPELIQFVSVTGSLHKKLTKYYPSLKTILVYKSDISDFSLRFMNKGQLLIAESIFPLVTTSTFKEASDLRHLGFYSNPGLEFQDKCFSELKHLRNLTIYNQTMPTLKYTTLYGLTKLKTLVVMGSDVVQIEEHAFKRNTHLKELTLDYNPLDHFHVNITFLKHLRKLSLMNTNLKKLDLPLFFPMKRLAILGLPNEAWSKVTVVKLAEAFPRLRSAIFDGSAETHKSLGLLAEEMKSAGLIVETLSRNKTIDTPLYGEDMKIISWD
ncbi:uncharacterized protein LOC126892463 [Diabrotica virgifera virgifera]|uniref:Uncharacterized protein n=1 Tax=Diabrotica virgifera virgifera TaxID=50390 RepID=A0ABM5L689_DIAVI|nr:uncharacterized protein LOC126892463 [Diabrotica virgifera virgifera]